MTALYERRGSEAGRRPAARSEEPALSELEFVGCTAVPGRPCRAPLRFDRTGFARANRFRSVETPWASARPR